ncbi:MAG: riboflavin biosynthesis protein RibD C-domain protein [Pseudonocardiales bacterium]|nr:riboflavin biosynthesis protein RibD C-domain protein [Pseudonocardiales bacterium]
MGTVFAVEYLTLDGVMEEPRWSGPYFNHEVQQFQYDNLFESDALLLGRVTYEGFKAAWPTMSDEKGFADRMNGMPKYVASTTLTEGEWNATIVDGDVPTAVAKLKESDQNLMIDGSAQLVETLRTHGLIDEYRLMIYPIIVGSGRRLFTENHTSPLKLTKTQISDSGVAILTYRPAE